MWESLDVNKNKEKVFQAGEGAGASGSFFFFSYDYKFLLKTITTTEKKILLEILDDYIQYLQDNANQSLLARIYGVFVIETEILKDVNVIIMQNTSKFCNPSDLKYKFDLKGSRVNRKVKFDPVRASNIEINRLGNQTFRFRQTELSRPST